MSLLVCIWVASILAACTGLEKTIYNIDEAEELFENFIITHEKNYTSLEEKQMRFEIFKNKLQEINKMNLKSDAEFGITRFSDYTHEEIIEFMGFKQFYEPNYNKCTNYTENDINVKDVPKSLDWSEKGAVTAIKNQKSCGSCWAFACIGNIESQYYIKSKNLQQFSEQQLIDCSEHTGGCHGGYMPVALSDLLEIGGVVPESSYPYIQDKKKCSFNKSDVLTSLKGCSNYLLTDEDKLKYLLATKGPLIIGLNGIRVTEYKKGIMSQEDCDGEFSGHAVVLVGYGTENGKDFWRLKNSWGYDFGESGYFRIHRGDNTCLMMTYVGTAEF